MFVNSSRLMLRRRVAVTSSSSSPLLVGCSSDLSSCSTLSVFPPLLAISTSSPQCTRRLLHGSATTTTGASGNKKDDEFSLPPPPPPPQPSVTKSSRPRVVARVAGAASPTAQTASPIGSSGNGDSAGAAASSSSSTTLEPITELAPPASSSIKHLAETQCPVCNTALHVKGVLHHVGTSHPNHDRTQLRSLVRERYTQLHMAIKMAWGRNAPRGALTDKAKGGYPCNDCEKDETGLPPLFPTLDALMKHAGVAHGNDGDDAAVPKRISADEVNLVIEVLRNGSAVSSSSSSSGNNKKGSSSFSSPHEDESDDPFALMMSSSASATQSPPIPNSDDNNNSKMKKSAEQPIGCEKCGQTFISEIALLQHYETEHAAFVFEAEGVVVGAGGSGVVDAFVPFSVASDDSWTNAVPAPYTGIPKISLAGDYMMLMVANQNKINGHHRHHTSGAGGVDPASLHAPGEFQSDLRKAEAMKNVVAPESKPISQRQAVAAFHAAVYGTDNNSNSNSSGGGGGVLDIPPAPPLAGVGIMGGSSATGSLSSSAAARNQSTTDSSSPSIPSFIRCEHCPQKFKSEGAYYGHLYGKHGVDVNSILPSINHTKSSSGQPILGCRYCGNRTFATRLAYEDHMKAKHNGVAFDYPMSSLSSTSSLGSSSSSASLSNSSSTSARMVCAICGNGTFTTHSSFVEHLKTKHGILDPAVLPAPAGASGSPSPGPSGAAASARYACEHCKKSFVTYNGYENHVRDKHGMSPKLGLIQQQQQKGDGSDAGGGDGDGGAKIFMTAPPELPSLSQAEAINGALGRASTANASTAAGGGGGNSSQGASSSSSSSVITDRSGGADIKIKSAWWCNTCERGFDTARSLHGHLMSKHMYRTQPIPCPGCRRTCPDQFSLFDHITGSHKGIDPSPYAIGRGRVCEHCGKRFLVDRELDVHVMKSHVGAAAGAGGGSSGNAAAAASGGTGAEIGGAQRFRQSF